jgi:hypothetical protein
LKLPASSLFNYETVVKLHPGLENLTAIQLLSYHLALHRPSRSPSALTGSEHDPFGPFVASLPAAFDTHPLWLAHAHAPPASRKKWKKLSGCLTASLKAKTDDVERRFHNDWDEMSKATVRFPIDPPT